MGLPVRIGTQTAALAVAVLAAACGADAPPAQGAILITLDTTRADALATYGGSPMVAPYLDHLAEASIVFERAHSVAPLTLPAHASMLTGLLPPRHTVHDNGIAVLPGSAVTLAERARAAGLRTAAFVGATVLDRAFGLDQGFETWDQPEVPEGPQTAGFGERPAREVTAAARRWIDGLAPDERYFLWVHLYDPHAPFAPAPAFLRQAGGDPYLGEVAAVDAAIGELLAPLEEDGRLDRAVLLVVADHGEALGEHREPTHGALCYEATVRVPLFVRLPGARRAGERSRFPASVVDVDPTLGAALGLAREPDVDGIDLLAAPGDGRRGVYVESYSGYLNYGWSPLAGWIEDDQKYLHSSSPELYRLDSDPDEARDLYDPADPAVAAGRRGIAAAWSAARLDAPETRAFDAELLTALRRLGYAATGAPLTDLPAPLEPSERPAPRDLAGELTPLFTASAHVEAGDFGAAEQLLGMILDGNPGHAAALELRAFARLQEADLEGARADLERRLSIGPERADVWLNLGHCRGRLGDAAGELEALERAFAIDAGHAQVRAALAERYAADGRDAEAAALREESP